MSDDKTPAFNAEMLGEALAELGRLAHDAGRVIDVAIYLLGVPVSVLTPNALPRKFRNEVLQQAQPLL